MSTTAIALSERTIANRLFWAQRAASMLVVPNYTPDGWYECDVLAVTKAGYMVEFEIKLSVSDFRADAKKSQRRFFNEDNPSPTSPHDRVIFREEVTRKHERLAAADPKGPSRFFYVVPEGMIEAADVPEWAGLRYVQDNGLLSYRSAKPAPIIHRQKIVDCPRFCAQAWERIYHRYWAIRARTGSPE